jgi:hypothetical protein
MRSTDRGRTWSQPAIAAELGSVGVNDPESGDPVASGTRLQPAVAVDPAEVRVFVAWQDARFSQGQADAIALSWSSDGARTWSAPVKANATPPRCQPQPGGILAVAGGGDRRDSGRRLLRLPPQRRGRRAADGSLAGALPPTPSPRCAPPAGKEARLTRSSFDMRRAHRLTSAGPPGFFLGDYMGLTSIGRDFLAVFAQPTTTTRQACSPPRAHPSADPKQIGPMNMRKTAPSLSAAGFVPSSARRSARKESPCWMHI